MQSGSPKKKRRNRNESTVKSFWYMKISSFLWRLQPAQASREGLEENRSPNDAAHRIIQAADFR
jgi:hypothetical protein